MKTTIEHFRDWEGYAFGRGYGTGERPVLTALSRFLSKCNHGYRSNAYEYKELEEALSPAVAWLLIDRLIQLDMLEYGTSPRYAWLTGKGEALWQFMCQNSITQLVEYATRAPHDYIHCYPDHCNCEDGSCINANPFWARGKL